MKGFISSEEAVSESLGFVLMASVLTLAMATVLMLGYPIYVDSINEGHMQNMEEGFYLLSDNGNKVAMYESPAQSSELKLNGGMLYANSDAGTIAITVSDISGTQIAGTTPQTLSTIEYSQGNTKVSYFMGGVFKKQGNTATLLKAPPIYDDNALVVPLITLNNPNNAGAIGGKGLTRVTFSTTYFSKTNIIGLPSSKCFDNANNRIVTIKINSEYNDALKRYFEDSLHYIASIDPVTGELTATKTYPGYIMVYIVPGRINVNIA